MFRLNDKNVGDNVNDDDEGDDDDDKGDDNDEFGPFCVSWHMY